MFLVGEALDVQVAQVFAQEFLGTLRAVRSCDALRQGIVFWMDSRGIQGFITAKNAQKASDEPEGRIVQAGHLPQMVQTLERTLFPTVLHEFLG